MTLSAAAERLAGCLDELRPLLQLNWTETAPAKHAPVFDPAFVTYLLEEQKGALLFLGLREQGRLLGYFLGFVGPGLHYRTCLTCITDSFYVHPDARGRHGGARLLRAAERELRRRGAQRWFISSKLLSDASRLFEAMRFEPVETYYAKDVGA